MKIIMLRYNLVLVPEVPGGGGGGWPSKSLAGLWPIGGSLSPRPSIYINDFINIK